MSHEQKTTLVNEYVRAAEANASSVPELVPHQSAHRAAYAAQRANANAWEAIGYCELHGIEFASVAEAIRLRDERVTH